MAAAIALLVLVAGGLAWVFVPQPAMASMFDWSRPAGDPDALHRRQLQRHYRLARQRGWRQRRGVARSRVSGCPHSRAAHRASIRSIRRWSVRSPRSTKPRRRSGVSEAWVTAARGSSSTSRCAARLAASSPSSIRQRANPGSAAPRSARSRCRSCSNCSLSRVRSRPRGRTHRRSRSMPDRWRRRRSRSSGARRMAFIFFIPCAIETLSAQGGLNYVRARMALPEFAKANVRTEGRRVYVDLTWPLDGEDDRADAAADDASAPRGTGMRPPRAGAPSRRATRRSSDAQAAGRAVSRGDSSRSINASARSVRSCCPPRSQDRRTSMRRSIRRSRRSKPHWSGCSVPPQKPGSISC